MLLLRRVGRLVLLSAGRKKGWCYGDIWFGFGDLQRFHVDSHGMLSTFPTFDIFEFCTDKFSGHSDSDLDFPIPCRSNSRTQAGTYSSHLMMRYKVSNSGRSNFARRFGKDLAASRAKSLQGPKKPCTRCTSFKLIGKSCVQRAFRRIQNP